MKIKCKRRQDHFQKEKRNNKGKALQLAYLDNGNDEHHSVPEDDVRWKKFPLPFIYEQI